MSTKPDDFNWVQAKLDCSLSEEFLKLVVQAKNDVTRRKRSLKREDGFDVSFSEPGEDKTELVVSRKPLEGVLGSSAKVTFRLRNDHISVIPISHDPLILRIGLNDDGDCRYTINEKGQYQPWQVLKLALEQILFECL